MEVLCRLDGAHLVERLQMARIEADRDDIMAQSNSGGCVCLYCMAPQLCNN